MYIKCTLNNGLWDNVQHNICVMNQPLTQTCVENHVIISLLLHRLNSHDLPNYKQNTKVYPKSFRTGHLE